MFNATHFTYDGVYSGVYGLRIASFEDETTTETPVFSPTFTTFKSSRAKRFIHGGIKYDEAPECPITFLSEGIISDTTRRDILAWLTGRNEYKKLQIHQPDLDGYYYRCIFKDVQIIYVRGQCFGFSATAQFDSIYAYGKSKTISITGAGEEVSAKVVVTSDVVDDYIYPIVEFSISGQTEGVSISITNEDDIVQEAFVFEGIRENERVVVDNELKLIDSDVGGDRLSCFNKKWLKLRKGVNNLKIKINGTAKITVPVYVMIGF